MKKIGIIGVNEISIELYNRIVGWGTEPRDWEVKFITARKNIYQPREKKDGSDFFLERKDSMNKIRKHARKCDLIFLTDNPLQSLANRPCVCPLDTAKNPKDIINQMIKEAQKILN